MSKWKTVHQTQISISCVRTGWHSTANTTAGGIYVGCFCCSPKILLLLSPSATLNSQNNYCSGFCSCPFLGLPTLHGIMQSHRIWTWLLLLQCRWSSFLLLSLGMPLIAKEPPLCEHTIICAPMFLTGAHHGSVQFGTILWNVPENAFCPSICVIWLHFTLVST